MNKKPRKRWTQEEVDTITRWYGRKDTETIMKLVGCVSYRSFVAKCNKLGLGKQYEAEDSLTRTCAAQILGVKNAKITRFIMTQGLRAKSFRFGPSQEYIMIRLEDFVEWLEKNPALYDASKIEYMALATEPKWLTEKRKVDFLAARKNTLKNRVFLGTKNDVAIKDPLVEDLLELKRRFGVSQAQLAAMFSLSKSYINLITNYNHVLSAQMKKFISARLKTLEKRAVEGKK